MRAFAKAALCLAGALSAALAGTAVAVLCRPQWFATPRAVSTAVRVLGASFRPRWKTLDVEIRSIDFWTKEITVRSSGFCFDRADPRAHGCLKRVDARFTVELYFFGARIARVSKLEIAGSGIFWAPVSSSKSSSPLDLAATIPAPLLGVPVDDLRVDLPSNVLVGSSATAKVSLTARAGPTKPLSVEAALELLSGTPPRRETARLSLKSDLLRKGRLYPLEARGTFNAASLHGGFKGRAEQAGSGVSLRLTAQAAGRGARYKAAATGHLRGKEFTLEGAASVRQSSGALRGLELTAVKAEGRFGADGWRPEILRFDCGFALEPAPVRRLKSLRLPKAVKGTLAARARMAPTWLEKDRFEAEADVALRPYKNWYEFHGGIEAKATGRLSRLRSVEFRQKSSLAVKAAHFEDAVAFLAGTRYAVPAPLHVLKGPLSLEVRGESDPRGGRQEFAYDGRADLEAGRQKLKLGVSGTLSASDIRSPERSFAQAAEIRLEEVALQAPHLDALRMPTMKLDPRIKTAKARRKERAAAAAGAEGPASFSAAVHIQTVKPAILYTDLSKTPVPVSLDLRLQSPSGGLAGTVGVGAMEVELFRRSAQVDHLRFVRGPGDAGTALDGLLVYTTDDAVIRIRLLGTADKPRVELESEPPMRQEEIVALLLYGRAPKDLDTDQQSTVDNTQTAMSNEAFGLASLFLFASTPIQYVGYDEPTRAYTMKFRIPGGETVELNSNFGSTSQVQLSRPLARHLEIRAQARNTLEQGNAVTTLIEWFNRY